MISGSKQEREAAPSMQILLVVCAAAILVTACLVLFYSFFRGFDLTDEADYLYLLAHPDVKLFVMDQFVWGHLGRLVGAGVVAYRFAAFILVESSALFLAYGVRRYLADRGVLAVPNYLFLIFAATGALGYFSIIRPTLSYNTSGLTGIDVFFAALLCEAAARTNAARTGYLAVAVLGLTLATLARLTALPVLLGFAVLLIGFLAPERGVRERLGAFAAFLGIFVLVTAFLYVMGYRPQAQLHLITLIGQGSHSAGAILLNDFQSGVELLKAASFGAARLIVVYVLILCAAQVFFHRAKAWRRGIATAIAGIYAFWTAFTTVRPLPFTPNPASTGDVLHSADLLPHIYGDGLPLLSLVIVFVILWLVAELVFLAVQPSAIGATRAAWPALRPFILVFIVLGAALLLPFFGTNTGLFVRSILNMAPAAIFLCVVLMALCGRLSVANAAIIPAVYIPFAVTMFALVFCNSVLVPFRVNGSDFAQTSILPGNGILGGLRVSPAIASLKAQVDTGLRDAGLNPATDRVFAGYDLPGLVLFSGASALGPARILSSNPSVNFDGYYCDSLRDEGMKGVQRLVGIDIADLSPHILGCLAREGVDIRARTDHVVSSLVTISVFPVAPTH